MKFMLMLQGTQADYDAMSGNGSPGSPVWTKEDLEGMFQFMQTLNEDLAASGELAEGHGLTEPSQAGLVYAGDGGRPVLSDDPYGVDREVLVGFWVLDCKNFERATEIAARIQGCPVPEGSTNYAVIVRPIQEEPPVS